MQPPLKYQPYHGYGCAHPFLWYPSPAAPKRIRTRSDWRYPSVHEGCLFFGGLRLRHEQVFCGQCGKVHCVCSRCYTPWKRSAKRSGGSTYEKRRVHQLFRRAARVAIWRELRGNDIEGGDVSHAFIISGNYLD